MTNVDVEDYRTGILKIIVIMIICISFSIAGCLFISITIIVCIE